MTNRLAKYDPSFGSTVTTTVPSLFDVLFPMYRRDYVDYTPDVDRTDTAVTLTWLLPGFWAEHVSVAIPDGILGGAGSRKAHSFTKKYELPSSVIEDEISATMKDGVLVVTLPLPQPEVRKIPIDPG